MSKTSTDINESLISADTIPLSPEMIEHASFAAISVLRSGKQPYRY
jgi:hypothetical protein